MSTYNLTILSYHKFTAEDDPYVFSRTYKQFASDLAHKDWDFLCMDDGHASIIKACEMMREKNMRAKIFISIDLIGQKGYCTWDDIWRLSRYHDIENHGLEHKVMTNLHDFEILLNIKQANGIIREHTGRKPHYFAAPWNQYNNTIEQAVKELGMQLMKNRIDIKNDTR